MAATEAPGLRERWANGTPTLNAWLSIPSPVTAEAVALQGFDSVTIDMQHGLIDYSSTLAMLQAIRGTSVTTLVRVPWQSHQVAMQTLDAGADGVICPVVDTGADAQAFVAACRYPPVGIRSIGPTRAALYRDDYLARANASVITIAQIESASALNHLDDILSTPGLDCVYVGPADLGASMGRPPVVDSDDSVILEAIETVQRSARRRGVIAGIHCATLEYAHRMIEAGYLMITVQNDLRLLMNAERDIADRFYGVNEY